MTSSWTASPTRTFLNELLNLPKNVSKQVPKKVEVLEQDPISAQGDAKKLKDSANVYRVRIGGYRLFYTFGQGWIKLLSIRKRDERTYELELPDFIPPIPPPDRALLEPQIEPAPVAAFEPTPFSVERNSEGIATALPYPLTETLLKQWRIPQSHWLAILSVQDADALLELPLPDEYLNRILDNLYPRSLEEINAQPEFLLTSPDDLERFAEGTLSHFLLKLDAEQEKLLNFGRTGPILVKGGPGTGKSTLALYRVQKLRSSDSSSILFTTYTNALVNYSEQLLSQLFQAAPNTVGVKVATVDSLIYQRYVSTYGKPKLAKPEDCLDLLEKAIKQTELPASNVFDRQVRQQTLERLGAVYILQEITSVIQSWNLTTLSDYLEISRRGRGYPLRANIREAIWAVYQTWQQLMAQKRLINWESMRCRALEAALQLGEKPYDAIVIDEAQDLSPVALRFLIALTPDLDQLYLTADASQSLYQRGFSWQQIHSDLRVSGRTLHLKRNYRNTQQIIAACAQILEGTEAGDQECFQQQPSPFVGNVPTLLLTDDPNWITKSIKDFLLTSAKQFRLPLHATAILCPQQRLARRTANQLAAMGLKARFVSGKEIELESPYIKVMTLHSAKGLEFPFVVILGLQEDSLPQVEPDLPLEERSTILDEQRRLFYVGSSRAMRSLMVCGSKGNPSPFLASLTEPTWQYQEI